MLTRVVREYAFNPQYGLDTYLSVRIRHGTLLAALRSPIANADLITQRLKESGDYRRNDHWLERLGPLEAAAFTRVDALLSQFARDFDSLIETIVKQWVQIQRVDGDAGLFRLSIPLDFVENTLAPAPTVERLLDLAFLFLGEAVEETLEELRRRLQEEAKPHALALLSNLSNEVERAAPYSNHEDLEAAVGNARTELSRAFDRVTDWFHLSKGASNEPFAIIDAVRLAEETIRLQQREFEVSYSESSFTPPLLEGGLLPLVYDVFLNLFENIVKHADASQPVATVSVIASSRLLKIEVRNQVGPHVVEDRRKRLEAVLGEMRGEDAMLVVSREGGSGLHKVRTILSRLQSVFTAQIIGSEMVVMIDIPIQLI
jgi:hypothetical protein